jgi:hypothetical protein
VRPFHAVLKTTITLKTDFTFVHDEVENREEFIRSFYIKEWYRWRRLSTC